MSETSDQLLRGYQAQEKRFLERRFPLRFASENPTLRELYRQAKRLRAEGDENAEKLRAEAERQRTEILADAYREAEGIRGEGDAKSADVYASAYSRNADFYSFYRSMQAYREAIGTDSDVLVISPDSEFFKYLNRSGKR